MEAWENNDLYFIDSVISRIPIICSIIVPFVIITYVTGLHVFQIFIINAIVFFMYARKITRKFLEKFSSGKGLGYDYMLIFIIATMILIVGVIFNKEIESKTSIAIIIFITLLTVIYFNSKIFSKSNLLIKYQDLISSLLSINKIEVIRNKSGITTLGYIELDDNYVLITITEGINKIHVNYESNDKFNGIFTKEWTFFDNKNQTEIFKEIDIQTFLDSKNIEYYRKKYKHSINNSAY